MGKDILMPFICCQEGDSRETTQKQEISNRKELNNQKKRKFADGWVFTENPSEGKSKLGKRFREPLSKWLGAILGIERGKHF